MKKLLAGVAVFLLLCTAALAETFVVPLADGQLTFTPFEGGHVLTKETSASVFNRLGMRQREVFAWMDEEQIDVLMYDQDFGCDVLLSVYETDQLGYETYGDEDRKRMCASFREHYEQYGYDVHDVSFRETEQFAFLTAFITLTYADGATESRFVYETCREGYSILMTMFVLDDHDPVEYANMASVLADSLRYELHSSAAILRAQGVTIRLTVPEGMTLHASPEELAITLSGDGSGEIIGCLQDPAGAWILLWRLDENAPGNMNRLSDAGVRSLYQARARTKKSAGCTVTLAEDHPESRQRYIRLAYEFDGEDGARWYAEEYYTKQAGWGVSVTAYSCGAELPEAVQNMLETIVNSQMVMLDE